MRPDVVRTHDWGAPPSFVLLVLGGFGVLTLLSGGLGGKSHPSSIPCHDASDTRVALTGCGAAAGITQTDQNLNLLQRLVVPITFPMAARSISMAMSTALTFCDFKGSLSSHKEPVFSSYSFAGRLCEYAFVLSRLDKPLEGGPAPLLRGEFVQQDHICKDAVPVHALALLLADSTRRDSVVLQSPMSNRSEITCFSPLWLKPSPSPCATKRPTKSSSTLVSTGLPFCPLRSPLFVVRVFFSPGVTASRSGRWFIVRCSVCVCGRNHAWFQHHPHCRIHTLHVTMSQRDQSDSPPPAKKTRTTKSGDLKGQKGKPVDTKVLDDFVGLFIAHGEGDGLSHKGLKLVISDLFGMDIGDCNTTLSRRVAKVGKKESERVNGDRMFPDVILLDKLTSEQRGGAAFKRLVEAGKPKGVLTHTLPAKLYAEKTGAGQDQKIPKTQKNKKNPRGKKDKKPSARRAPEQDEESDDPASLSWPDVTELGWRLVEEKRHWCFVVESGCTHLHEEPAIVDGSLCFAFNRLQASKLHAAGVYHLEYCIPPSVVVDGDVTIKVNGGLTQVMIPAAAPRQVIATRVSVASWQGMLDGCVLPPETPAEEGEDPEAPKGEEDLEDWNPEGEIPKLGGAPPQ